MKVIVTHTSPDLDGITSVWLIKKFLQGWENAEARFVPAGERYKNIKYQISNIKNPIEKIDQDETIHVDTGFGSLDHHQTEDQNISAASLTWDFIKEYQKSNIEEQRSEKFKYKEEAVGRIVKVVTEIDHFKEVFWKNPTSDRYEFSLIGILEGLKTQKPGQDMYYVDFISQCLDAVLHEFESKVWAEKEIKEKGKKFQTKWGEGIGIETINDTVLKLAQKMGYVIVLRKDPRKGYVRVNARPSEDKQTSKEVDLTLICEKLKKIDPDATWFLHVSKKILLNGSAKNPKMRPTNLSLDDIIKVIEKT